jgi:ABC-type branched-subunit amino acid transport system substrate-binding protein
VNRQQAASRRGRALAAGSLVAALALSGCASQIPPGKFIGDGPFGARSGAASNAANLGGPAGPQAGVAPGAGQGTTTGAGAGLGSGAAGGGPAGTGSSGGGSQSGGGALAGVRAGSCAGFTNGHGISDSAITVANASDVSGPISGLFTSAQQAAKAYAAYFNATSSVCGRKISVTNLDSQTNSIGDQDAATSACSGAFAMVGSMSAFDNGGSKTVTDCGIPDLRAITTTPERTASPVSFGTDSINSPQVTTAQYNYLKSTAGDAYLHAGIIYLDAGAAVPNAIADKKTAEAVGYKFAYEQAVAVTTFNYAPYAAKISSAGVKFLQYTGAYQYAIRLKQALDQQGVKLTFLMDSVAYDPAFVTSSGSSANGTYAFVNTALFEEAAGNPEMQLYLHWLHQVAPNGVPSFFGIYAWGAMKLFTQLAVQLGGRLSRSTLLDAIRGVHSYTASGLFTTQDVGGKKTPPCQAIIQLESGKWIRRGPSPYLCGPVVNTAR